MLSEFQLRHIIMMKDYGKLKENVKRTQLKHLPTGPLWRPISGIVDVIALVSSQMTVPELDCRAIVFSDSRLINDVKPVKAHSPLNGRVKPCQSSMGVFMHLKHTVIFWLRHLHSRKHHFLNFVHIQQKCICFCKVCIFPFS